jgi:beta-mannosidase
VTVLNLNGSVAYKGDLSVTAPGSAATVLSLTNYSASPVHFIKLELRNAGGKLLSDNFYWRASAEHPDELEDLNKLPVITLTTKVARHDSAGKCLIDVTLHNPGKQAALMTHLQLRRMGSKERVLPVYYTDNYVSLMPNETKTITIEAASADLKGEVPLVAVDGWNINVTPVVSSGVSLSLNDEAQVSHWPATGLAVESHNFDKKN